MMYLPERIISCYRGAPRDVRIQYLRIDADDVRDALPMLSALILAEYLSSRARYETWTITTPARPRAAKGDIVDYYLHEDPPAVD